MLTQHSFPSPSMVMARARFVALVVAVVALLFSEGEGTAPQPAEWSEQRRHQVQSLLKRLNKPPIASIESPDGDIIDCVHISKQPAFDHPFLKNHTIQMQPSYHPAGLNDEFKAAFQPVTQMWHQNGKCPENTIPIQRTTEEDILRASSVRSYGKKWPRSIPNPVSNDHVELDVTTGHQHAVASTQGSMHYGTEATFNVWQPKLEGTDDFSLAQLWILRGSYGGKDLNTIEAGWQVCPQIYGDNNSRIFIYWTRDAYETTGCYNLKCSGFMQTNNQIALGSSISPVSIYDGSQYEINIFIQKDPKSGNWWLQLGSQVLGYWPSSIFSNLADSASMVMWGGEVYSPNRRQTSTQMGSGHFPEEGFRKASYIRSIQVMDSSKHLNSPSDVSLITEAPNCYKVQNGSSREWGTYIYYGGPGKNPNCQ